MADHENDPEYEEDRWADDGGPAFDPEDEERKEDERLERDKSAFARMFRMPKGRHRK